MNQAYFDDLQAALREAARRRAHVEFKEHITKVRSSRYGGFAVVSIPVDIYVDMVDMSIDEGGQEFRGLTGTNAVEYY